MKKLILTLIMTIIIFIFPLRSSSQVGLNMVVPSSDAIFLSGFISLCETAGLDGNKVMTSLLGNFDEYAGSIKTAVTKISELSQLYSTSKDVIMMTEYTVKIYQEYHSNIKLVLSNYLIFSEAEVKNFLHMLDYAAFRCTALETNKKRSVDAVAGGAYFNFLKLSTTQSQGGQITIKTIIDEQRLASAETISTYKDVKAMGRYIESAIYKRQVELGIVDFQKVRRSVIRDWENGTYYNPIFSFKDL